MKEPIASDTSRHRGSVLECLLTLTIEMTERAECGSVSLVDHRRLYTLISTDARSRSVDAIHNQAGEGPALSATSPITPGTYLLADPTDSTVWPRFARLVTAAENVGGILATVLRIDNRSRGVLTLVAGRTNMMMGGDKPSSALLGAISAAVRADREVLRTRDRISYLERDRAIAKGEIINLHRALEARDPMDQARAIIMDHERGGQVEAFRPTKGRDGLE